MAFIPHLPLQLPSKPRPYLSTRSVPSLPHRCPHSRPTAPSRLSQNVIRSSLPTPTRRTFLQLLSLLALPFLPSPAQSISGLKLFPLSSPLMNRYYFVRAGESATDARGIVVTNPVWKLSVDLHGLTARGRRQALAAARALNTWGVGFDAWIWCGTQTSSLETADLLAARLGVGREQVVPEYAFLDSRGVGALEWGQVGPVERGIGSVDSRGVEERIQLGVDGTPGESVMDVFVRVRQLLSKIETAWEDQDVVVVAPDSYTLAILETAMMGESLTQHAKYAYRVGEARQVQPKILVTEEKKPISLSEVLSSYTKERI